MIFMLKRHNLLSKKNAKKHELERTTTMVKQQIELQLKHQNKTSENTVCDLENLKPNFNLRLSAEIK